MTITAPWSADIVAALNEWQRSGLVHPYTCGGNRMDAAHSTYQAEHGGDFGQLIATTTGWVCPACSYRQDWAHAIAPADQPNHSAVPRAEFVTRFRAHMLRRAGTDVFEDGESIADYATETAPSYWQTPWQRDLGPEECAEADMEYWGE